MPDVTLARPPRMADFSIWASACEQGLGMRPGETLAAYEANRGHAHSLALESSPLYEPIAELAREGFCGTVTELHVQLNCMVGDGLRRSVRWPKAPNALSSALRRMTGNLRNAGIELNFSRADVLGRNIVSIAATDLGKKASVIVSKGD